MKKTTYYLLAFLALVVSCKTSNELTEVTSASPQNSKNPKANLRTLPAGDPNLDANWDWTNQTWNVYFNNANGTIGSVSTLNPFTDGTQKIFGNTNVSQADMYPAQGWMLVARDFGTPTGANAYPFILLYNKHRGVLRVAILRTYDVLSSFQQITLSFATTASYPKLFKFASTVPDMAGANANNQFTQSALTYAGVQQWMIAEFNLQGYSASMDDFASINVNVSEVVNSSVSLTGSIQLDGSAQPQVGEPGFWGGVKTITSFIAKASEPVSKIVKKPESTFAGLSSAATVLEALFDAVSGFSGGDSGSSYNIKLNGSTTQQGTITLSSPKTSFSVYLKSFNTPAYHALQSIPWGVFDINPIPYTITDYYDNFDHEGNPLGYTNHYFTLDVAPNFVSSVLSVNPSIVNNISQIRAKFVSGNSYLNSVTPFESLSSFESRSYTFNSTDAFFNTVGIGLEFIFNNGSVVYNVIPLH